MKNNTTSITYENVKNAVNKIVSNRNELKSILEDFTSTVNSVTGGDVFIGQASSALDAKFQELKKNFDEYINTVDQFSKMISMAENRTEETESSIQKMTQNL